LADFDHRDEKSDDRSKTIGELAKALALAQGEFAKIAAERTGQEGHRKYKYADLASFLSAARESLSKHELAVIQKPSNVDAMVHVETVLAHSSGEWISSFLAIKAANDTAKGIGSAITYARRYSLGAMLGLAPDDDDDGTLASTPQGVQKKKSTVTVNAKDPCTELDRNRLVRACRDLEWSPAKLTEVIATVGANTVKQLSRRQALSLAERLEKKFLNQQAEETFSPGSDGQG
jgi:hypothetical protein